MGLLLSILVFSVGVLEALACVRHIQQGILPAWAPRHVTTTSGRRLLRERWRKSTSRDEGGELPVEAAGESPPTPASIPSRGRPAPLQIQERQGSPALHRARTPDIHWPEPVPHSPVRNVEQTLPSPVEETPGDLSWPQGDALVGRRRTSVTETLPPVEHSHAEPLAPGSPVPSAEFARETQEPRRCKPAKASSFEEARVEPAFQAPAPAFPEVTPAPRQPDVISLSYEDHSAAGPRAAVVGRIQITATKESSGDEEPEPWPIVNIDTVVTSDDEGDITPPPNSRSRRVSFDPIPTVVSFDTEKPVATEEKLKPAPPVPPTVKVSHDLEDLLRQQMPAFVDQIIQEALLKATDVLSLRDRDGPLNGVSLFLKDVISSGVMGNENGEEYKDTFEAKEEEVPGVGDNIYRIMEKLQRGEDVNDSILPVNNLQKQETDLQNGSTTLSSIEPYENEAEWESQLQSQQQCDTFQPHELMLPEDIEILHPDNLELKDKYSVDIGNDEERENTYYQSGEVTNTENLSTYVPGKNQDEQEIGKEHDSHLREQTLPQVYPEERDGRNEDEEKMLIQIEESQLPNEPSSVCNERSLLESVSQPNQIEVDKLSEDAVYPDEQVLSITQEVPEESTVSPPTPTSTTHETVSSSAPLATNNGPEEAKEATTLAKQVSPGPQGALDEAQNTRASAAADSAETRISSDEPHEFDIEPGPLASPDVRSTSQPPDEQPASQPSEGLSAARREEAASPEGRSQDTSSAAASAPPPSPPPSPPPPLASAPTTDQQQQATDSTPSADRNETSRSKEKKKKHILRKRSSKEKRGKRVQTPQASPSPSEDEEEAAESTTVALVAAPPPPPAARVTREPSPRAPPPPPARQEPEDSARELTLGTSSTSTSSSSGGAAAARPTTPAAAPQPEAFWVRDAPPPPSASSSLSATATPFGPSVKKPYRRKDPSENMPGFAPKNTRFEWPPKPREERPIRPRSAAFSAAAPADPKEHFPPPPPPVPERPPTPVVPEPTPEQTVASAASAPFPTPNAASPVPGAAAAEQPVANGTVNGTAPDDSTPNGTAAPEEADAARDAAASPAPGRFKFEVEMPTTRPTIQPVERDPKEVVRKLTHLKQANPGVASEMLMSILGFHCPH